jgi:DNA-binding LacI/PurR family transcriptional regulator
MVALKERPTALLCSNDMTAIGVMRAAYELHIEVPKELSVVGFDDIRMADFMVPPLTTIQMSQSELATLAFQALLKETKRDTPDPEGSEYTLKTRLVLRSSTTFPPNHADAKARSTTANPKPARSRRK